MSFQQGLSGLNASSKNLEVIGNNIANANTYGSKMARAEFSAVYATALNGSGGSTVGIGTALQAVAQQFTQGNVSTTDNPLDLAINGSGFFQVSDNSGTVTYTRNGQFKLDRDGYIVNNAADRLMGYAADDNGMVQPGRLVPLQLPTGGIDPNPSTRAEIELNFDSRKAVTQPAAAPLIDFASANTYNNATSLTLYDMKGQEVSLGLYFQKTGNDAWDVYATANGTTVGGTAAAPLPITSISFQSDGSGPISPNAPVTLNIPASTNAAGAQTEAISGLLFDFSGVTQFGSAYGITDMRQDGFSAGQLNSIAIEANGIVTARYSNGQSKPAGQIELATFRNPQGLQPLADNAWARTYASGDPIYGVPGDAKFGVLQAGALEESNIDLTGELVNMITAQRIYQANAQTIKTQDQVLQTLVNLR
ncbi:MAG TPA: flagellar hook protein FlgE [Rubrivivax sp.]|nr:flagellar hook protein FlgE [Rubrivivax sp.]